MDKVDVIMEKIAKFKEKEKTYPLSRAYMTAANVVEGSFPGFLYNRALQGRVNVGEKGVVQSERDVMERMEPTEGKTFPISRAVTNPKVMGGISAGLYGIQGALAAGMGPGKKYMLPIALGSAVIGGASGYGGAMVGRALHARSLKGRAEKNRTGWGARERGILKQIKKDNG